jgi:hypothetical protein
MELHYPLTVKGAPPILITIRADIQVSLWPSLWHAHWLILPC